MELPFFYNENLMGEGNTLTVNEDTSRHLIQVLRMKTGDRLKLTDGKGKLLTCMVDEPHKKHCTVIIERSEILPGFSTAVTIAISLIKNPSRFEWFLEKATELGITSIVPLICERTEKERFRYDRMQGICISAMLQSQQAWLPALSEPVQFIDFIQSDRSELRLIAHCEEDKKLVINDVLVRAGSVSILIGPEGDFTSAEINLALKNGIVPVSLGSTRLRTETAGIAAVVLMRKYD